MISDKQYKQKTDQQWTGTTVKSYYEMSNGWCKIPAGTELKITRKYKGFSLISEPCSCCGVQVKISRVSPGSLAIVEKDKSNA